MHRLIILFLFLLSGVAFSAAGDASSRCNSHCGSTAVPYPFGFSGDCPITLACNAATSTPLLPHNTMAMPYPILSFNSTASTFTVSIPPLCKRRIVDAKASLGGGGYAVSSRTGLFLRGGCRAPAAASNCSVSVDVMTRLFRTARCGADGNDTAWTCVVASGSDTPPKTTTAAARGQDQGQLMMLEDVDAAGCEHLLTAAVYGETPSLELGVAELGWWVDGTCNGANATATGGGQCAQNATCYEVATPSGGWGHRCACSDGMSGDGFAGGDGCYYGRRRRHKHLPAVAAGVSAAFVFLVVGLSAFFLRRKRRQNSKATTKTSKQARKDSRLFRGKPVEDDLEEGVAGPQRFSYRELAAATGNFSDDRRLGRGGFGSV